MDKLAENGINVILATPSGARPAWMSAKYPEVLRVQADRQRILHGGRHNHCYTSPIYREKTQLINRKLAKRYKDHPALLLWHIILLFAVVLTFYMTFIPAYLMSWILLR